MTVQSRTLQQATDRASFERMVRSNFDSPRAEVRISAGAEDGANTRRITLEVIDRLKAPWQGRWRVWVYLTAVQDGAPNAVGNTVALVAGTTALQAVTANAVYHLLTGTDGKAVFDLTVPAGAQTRYVCAEVDGQIKQQPFTWT